MSNELFEAAKAGNFFKVRELVDNGADVRAKDRDGVTLLHVAAEWGHTEISALLIEKGADVSAKDKYGNTPLYWADSGGHTEVVDLLKQHGAKDE